MVDIQLPFRNVVVYNNHPCLQALNNHPCPQALPSESSAWFLTLNPWLLVDPFRGLS